MKTYLAHCQFGVFCHDWYMTVNSRLKYMPYAQAGVCFNNGTVELYSYVTKVAQIDEHGFLTVFGLYSMTTRRHISAFLREYAPNLNYYDAKKCYNDNISMNIVTGEIIPCHA